MLPGYFVHGYFGPGYFGQDELLFSVVWKSIDSGQVVATGDRTAVWTAPVLPGKYVIVAYRTGYPDIIATRVIEVKA